MSLTDFYPTLLDRCGLPPNDDVVGSSLKPLLDNPSEPWEYPAFTFKEDDHKSVQFGFPRYIEYDDGSMDL
ncbi:hypothetical protein [Roseimaritima multifibrata]|uniref:hypothetical protein n=1 Tax=Roseimaritima multifibrata TaxID=1930274 RepID=UPI0011A00BD1|nr:hypothetical protein [Roseimaritima multifibrata]